MFQEVNELEAVTAAAAGREALLLIYPEDEKEDMEIINLTDALKDFTSGASRCVFLADRVPESTVPEPTIQEEKPPEPKPRKNRKEIDIGKIISLHNAGWSNRQIAEDMRLTPTTVGKYLGIARERYPEKVKD